MTKTKMRLKKAISLICSIVLLFNIFSLVPMPAFARSETQATYTHDGYTINYSINSYNSWGNIQGVDITITNTSPEAIENWMLFYNEFEGNITNSIGARIEEDSYGNEYVRNVGYNGNISPNSSVTFSHSLNGAADFPSDIIMCQERVTKEDGHNATLNVTASWGNNFSGAIMLKNTSTRPIENWELTIDTNFTITEITGSWVAAMTNNGNGNYTLKGTYSSTLAPNSTAQLSFAGIKNGKPEILSHSLTEVVVSENIICGSLHDEKTKEDELEQVYTLNEDAEFPVEIQSNEETGVVTSIDGKFSEVSVTDADSAIRALRDVKALLEINNPANELVLDNVYESSTASYKSYFFNEVYNGIPVYGHTVTVVARDSGEILSLDSNFIKISDIGTTPTVSADTVKSTHDVDNAELVIYAFDEYESEPVLVYLCSTLDEELIVSATNLDVIKRSYSMTPNLESDFSPARDIYNYGLNPRSQKDSKGNLIWLFGQFGDVDTTEHPQLVLTSDEKTSLKISDTQITFNFADEIQENHISQLVQGSEDDRNNYIAERDKAVPVNDLSGNYHNEKGEWYVDVGVYIYNFDQYYRDIKVYGRVLTITENDEDKSITMDSNILSETDLANIVFPSSFADVSAIRENPTIGDLPLEIDAPVIYSWGEYENNPVFVYIFIDIENNRTYLVAAASNTSNGIVAGQILNEEDNSYYLGKGLNEASGNTPRSLVYFPVSSTEEMKTIKKNGVNENVVSVFTTTFTKDKVAVRGVSSFFYNPEAVTTLQSYITTYDFYVRNFNHHSSNNNKNGINNYSTINIRHKSWIGAGAAAGGMNIYYYTRGDRIATNGYNLSIMGHEYNHTVFSSYNTVRGNKIKQSAINEGYSDLFGYFVSNNRIHSNLTSFNVDFKGTSLQYLIDKGLSSNWGHSLTCYIYAPAAIMRDNSISMEDIYKLYYASLTVGKYSPTSNLNSVRVNVLKAAKALGFSKQEVQIIKTALDSVLSKDNTTYTLTVNAKDKAGNILNNANIKIRKSSETESHIVYNSVPAPVTPNKTYVINISAPGYISHNYVVQTEHKNYSYSVNLVEEGAQNGMIKIVATDYVSDLPATKITSTNLFTYNESGAKIKVVLPEFPSGIPLTNGTSIEFSVPAGYYVQPYGCVVHNFSVHGDDKAALEYSYRGLSYAEKTIVIDSAYKIEVFKEEPDDVDLAKKIRNFNIYPTFINDSNYEDRNGDSVRVARMATSATVAGTSYTLYSYLNSDILIGYNITSTQRQLLEDIKEQEKVLSTLYNVDRSGTLYSISITVGDDILVLTAEELLNNLDIDGNFVFAKTVLVGTVLNVVPNF